MPLQAGDIIRISNFEFADGTVRDKYLVVLAPSISDDWVLATTTSREYSRPKVPACHHGDRPSYFLGQLGIFPLETWVCLAQLYEMEPQGLREREDAGALTVVGRAPDDILCALLDCAARADDTTSAQTNALMGFRSEIGCP